MDTKTFGIFAILAIGLFASAAFAYQGDMTAVNPNYDEERHVLMASAIDNMDYDAWSSLMQGKGRVKEVVTADNFPLFVEMHNARNAGNLERANEIRAELGLGQGLKHRSGNRMGNGMGKMNGGHGRNRAI